MTGTSGGPRLAGAPRRPAPVSDGPGGNRMYAGVLIGAGTVIEPPCVIGKTPVGAEDGTVETRIGSGCLIRPFTTVYAGAVLGDAVQTGQGASIREDNVIGEGSRIGTNAVLEHGNRIGKRCRVHSGCFLEYVTLEDDVFVAPNVVFCDDPHPPCAHYADCVRGAVVKRGASIGSNSTILPGVVIGAGAVVGAGSVVTVDVPARAVVVGSPARVIKQVEDLRCRRGLIDAPYRPRTGRP